MSGSASFIRASSTAVNRNVLSHTLSARCGYGVRRLVDMRPSPLSRGSEMKRIILCVAVLVHFGALAAFAQGVGAISGTVTDSSGAVMPGVTVSLVSPGVKIGRAHV